MQFINLLIASQLFILSQYMSDISCQQFSYNNAPVPPRFLVPGSVPVPVSNELPLQNKRLLPPPADSPEDDDNLRTLRKPVTRVRPGIHLTNAFPLEQAFELTDNDSQTSSSVADDPSIFASKPIAETAIENETEDEFARSPRPTFAPTVVNTMPARTDRPILQSRLGTRPPSPATFSLSSQFFHSSTRFVDEGDEFTTKTQQFYEVPQFSQTTESSNPPLRKPNPENIGLHYERKQSPVSRPNNQNTRFSPQQPQRQTSSAQGFVDNKVIRTYDKSAKSKFEKSEVQHHEKRPKKPVAQVLRRYREDNPDGSITWGFENDDGSYKEETIGHDCVTRGKYGYIDPDGVRREYMYSQGLLCDKSKQEQNEEDGYIDYSRNKMVLPNGESVDLDHIVKHRARKPAHLKTQ